MKCMYSDDGCDFKAIKGLLIDHQEDCKHQPLFQCPLVNCPQKMALLSHSKLFRHLKNALGHTPECIEINTTYCDRYINICQDNLNSKEWQCWPPIRFTCHEEKQFYWQCVRNPKGFFYL